MHINYPWEPLIQCNEVILIVNYYNKGGVDVLYYCIKL